MPPMHGRHLNRQKRRNQIIMTTTQFAQTYLQFEQNIAKVLRKQKIYDEDLMHDTYIALYEYSQHAEIRDFVSSFVEFYKKLRRRQKVNDSHYDTCDNATMIEKYDRIDEDDWEYRERLGRQMDILLEIYREHPLPRERNHQRGCEILKLFCEGLSNVEIAKIVKIDESTVRKYIKRAILGFKSPSNLTTI